MKPVLIYCCLFSFVSCKTNTKPDLATVIKSSNTFNLPKDSLAFYFPIKSFSDKPSIDSLVQNWYSSALYSFKEPILSHDFTGHNIFRFLWLRSFHRPIVFSLHQNQTTVWLNTKILNKQPQFYDEKIGGVTNEERPEYIKEGYIVDKLKPGFLLKKADRKADIVYNRNMSLSKQDWIQFEHLLAKVNFWSLPLKIDDGSTDGAQWIFEAHFDNKYHLVDYHSPGGDYRELGVFIIKLSGLKEEIY